MNPNLLIKIADIINNNGSKYRAVIPCSKHDYMIQEGNKLLKSCCYVLRIMVSGKTKIILREAYGTFTSMTWTGLY